MPSDLARRVALAIEPEPGPTPNKMFSSKLGKSPRGCWYESLEGGSHWEPMPFDSDERMRDKILAAILERDKVREFIDALDDQLPWGQEIDDRKRIWLCLNATMPQICAALLAAVGGEHE